MSTRDTILDGLVSTFENITLANGFHSDIGKVLRKFIYWDAVFTYPSLMVLGGQEVFEDQMNIHTISRFNVRVIGYSKNKSNPEQAQCELIEDVLKCFENSTYNTYLSKMRPIQIDTDEGMLHEAGEGVGMFIFTIEVIYRYSRSSP